MANENKKPGYHPAIPAEAVEAWEKFYARLEAYAHKTSRPGIAFRDPIGYYTSIGDYVHFSYPVFTYSGEITWDDGFMSFVKNKAGETVFDEKDWSPEDTWNGAEFEKFMKFMWAGLLLCEIG